MKITYGDETLEINAGLSIREALKTQMEKSEVNDIIAAIYNNQIASLNHPINKDGTISFINRRHRDGRLIYVRGLLYVMSKAFYEVYPEALLTVNYQLSNSMYGTIDNMEVTDEMIAKVKNKMVEIVKKDLPITKVSMTQEEAEEFYKKEETLNQFKYIAIEYHFQNQTKDYYIL